MTRLKILALVTVFVLSLVIPALVSAQQTQPHAFYGDARLDGTLVVDGTPITAYVDGIPAGTVFVTKGKGGYGEGGGLKVSPQGVASYAGKTVTFTIGQYRADQTAPWTKAGCLSLT